MTAPTPRPTARYGWIPDLPDHRDHIYGAPLPVLATLPPSVDLRADCPKVYDQGQLGSCTANAIAAAFEFDLAKQAFADFMPSRLFIYYNERRIEGTVNSDSGAMIRDGIKSVSKQGVCAEDAWPYDIAKFAATPDPKAYTQARTHRVLSYQRIPQVLNQMRGCLAHGYPFVFGFQVYESFESAEVARTGAASLPAADEQPLGGHAVLCVGYDDASARFVVRNSWGTEWGMDGYFTLPYTYLTERSLSSDFWAIIQVAGS
jgi:C1A family cysteine protease